MGSLGALDRSPVPSESSVLRARSGDLDMESWDWPQESQAGQRGQRSGKVSSAARTLMNKTLSWASLFRLRWRPLQARGCGTVVAGVDVLLKVPECGREAGFPKKLAWP